MIDLNRIKLIIWDLDDTFWSGTLSESTNGEVGFIEQNINFIKQLTDRGIINSICSKNNFDEAKEKIKECGMWEYFVFPSINWQPKGLRIKNIISDMALREENTLFIDDNILNLEEAKYYCQQLQVLDYKDINQIVVQLSSIETKDEEHTRLKQYQVLEKKSIDKYSINNNEEFLRESNIKILIKKDCLSAADRIFELVARTNQLNFTKFRASKEELVELLNTKDVQSGYVQVADKYGDYGIVGFYAIRENMLIHFLFSCRTIGMGIEQYVYQHLNFPILNVSGAVAAKISKQYSVDYITLIDDEREFQAEKISASKKVSKLSSRILMKGPCDIQSTFGYLAFNNLVDTEFVFQNENTGVSIESYNHSIHIVQSLMLPAEEKEQVIRELPFSDEVFYKTSLFDKKYKMIFYSLLTDGNLGLYRRKQGRAVVAFGEWCHDLTNEANWSDYKTGRLYNANCNLTDEFLSDFKKKYEYIGRISAEQIAENILFIRQHLDKETTLVLFLGSEIKHEKNKYKAYEGRHESHREINEKIRKLAKSHSNIKLIELTEMVGGSELPKYTDTINHFERTVYFRIAEEIMSLVEKCEMGYSGKLKSKTYLYRTIFVEKLLKKPYHNIRNLLRVYGKGR